MGERDATHRVGGRLGERLAVLGHQRDRDPWQHARALQRADHDVERVLAGVADQRHVGEHHPPARLRGRRAFVRLVGDVAPARRVAGFDHVAARLHLLQHRAQRKDSGGLLTRIALHVDVALPDDLALVIGAVVAVVVGVLPLGRWIGRADRLAHQVAVHDAPNLDVQFADVDGDDSDPVGLLARQDHALTFETHEGRLVAVGKVGVGVVGERLAVFRGQPFQQRDATIGEPNASDAKGVAAHAHRRRMPEVRRN
nr:hypothetical protein Hi04_10k_c4586_00042 [uncultured bacterium]